MEKLDPMSDFFTARVADYDAHMLANVEGCKEAYPMMASLVPANTGRLLDLGCGTGLELDEIFKRLPNISVTGIDLTQAMLDRLKEKHPRRQMKLICGNYFTADFGPQKYDCAISFETMHHFSHEEKTGLYKKIHSALAPDGCYIECDYMVDTQEEEDHWFFESRRTRQVQKIPQNALVHYDTPCTIANQIAMLKAAGFRTVCQYFRMGHTALLLAQK